MAKSRKSFNSALIDAIHQAINDTAANHGFDTSRFPGWGLVYTAVEQLSKLLSSNTPKR